MSSTNKLKTLLHSDTHLNNESEVDDFLTSLPPEDTYDISVFAGDITNGKVHLIKYLISKLSKPAYLVCGNHDYYNNNIMDVSKYLLDAGLNLLKEGVSYTYNHNGVEYTLVGGTTWTSFLSNGRKARHAARKAAFNCIADFHCIKYGESKLSLDLMEYLHLKDWNWIAKFNNKPNTIIVTHFPCSLSAQNERWEGNILNPYFINAKITTGFNLFLSGHTHDGCDVIDKFGCRHVINPLGYKNEFLRIKFPNDQAIAGFNRYHSHKIIEY